MWRFSTRFSRPVTLTLIMVVLLVAIHAPVLAATPLPAGGKQDPQPSPLVECHVGLVLPLLLAGLATRGYRTRRRKR